MTDAFDTLAGPAEGYFMDRGSKFIAYAYPVADEAECHAHVARLRKAHPKARHFCTAWRLLPDASLERSNDDGEPSGSAGKPILGQLVRLHLTHAMVVVVRYFGGTKLGVPGLIEAYRASTADALSRASIVTRHVYRTACLRMGFDQYATFHSYCKQHQVPVTDTSFDTEATLTIALPASTAEEDLLRHLRQYTNRDYDTLEAYGVDLDMVFSWMDDWHIA
jgi:uncharacterized YigZ family protein